MLMTVSAARRTLHRGPLVFGDERQLRMLKLHPDREGGDKEEFIKLNNAMQVLRAGGTR